MFLKCVMFFTDNAINQEINLLVEETTSEFNYLSIGVINAY